MADLVVDGDELLLSVPGWQRVWALHRDITVPLSSVRRVDVPDNVWLALRGWRSSGVAIPGRCAYGTRRHGDGWSFTAVSKRYPEVVRVALDGSGRYAELLVSVPDARGVADRVADAAGIAR